MSEQKTETKQVGNDLFQQVVAQPYAAALAMVKAAGPRALTPRQAKAKRKNRAKSKVQKASRQRNRR